MKPETIGRVLGVGLRVAGRMAGRRLAGNATQVSNSSGGAARPVILDAATRLATGRVSATRTTAGVARGVGGFLKPFRRVGSSIFLEVVGVFFFLFVIVFGNWAWRLRDQAAQGPNHVRFLVYVGMALVFLYLTVSSFWRARRK